MDVWPLGANCSRSFCLTHLLMLTFSKKPIPMVGSWQMSVCDTKWQLFLLTPCISTPGAVFFPIFCSMAVHVFKMEMDSSRGGWNQHEGQHLTSGSQQTVSRRWCGHNCVINSHENHRLAGRLTSLPPSPPTPHPQTITGHPGSTPCCCCLRKLQAVA